MAIYKPNNFYPHLQEIDLTQENTFSCQVNTDGAMVSAARLTISSEDNILVYENLYQFVDINGNKDPIENKGFMELPMEPYKIDKSNISFGLIDDTLEPVYYKYAINDNGKVIYYDEYGENGKKIGFPTREEATAAQVYDEDGMTILYNQDVEDGMLNNYNRKVVIINNIDFITLHPELSYDVRKDYCPYNFYNVKLKDTYCFGLKFVNSSDENDVFLYPFKYLDYEKTDNGYNMKITYNTELLFDDMSKYDCYIVLLNDKDYTWDVKMYEHLFREDIDKGTLVTDGYITGSTKTVFWWDANKQTEDTLLNRKEIKEDYYVEINATEDNSDIFKEQLKLGRTTKGKLSIDESSAYYRYAINDNGKKIYYDEYGENGKRIGFDTETEANTIESIYDEDKETILDNIFTEKKDEINNEDLLKIENSLSPVCNVTSSGYYTNSTPLPYSTYELLETGQVIKKEQNIQRWKFTNPNVFLTQDYRYGDSFINLGYKRESYNYGIIDKDENYIGYVAIVPDFGDANYSNGAWDATDVDWKIIDNVYVKVTEKNEKKSFSILDNSVPVINGSATRCRNTYVRDDVVGIDNVARYSFYWNNYDINGNVRKLNYGSTYVSVGNSDTISESILNQDFYHYPFIFSDASTKVVGFKKSILSDFYDKCVNADFKQKINEVIKFYNDNYITVVVGEDEYYAKVFTPRPFSNNFYSSYSWGVTYRGCALAPNYNCLKYPSILKNENVLFDTTYINKKIYPNPYQGEVVAPYDDNEETKWTQELITTEDDIAAFLKEGDYATALELPSSERFVRNVSSFMPSVLIYEKYFSLVYPPVAISDNITLKTRIAVQRGSDSSTSTINNTLYTEVDVIGGRTYEISGLLKISGLLLTNDEFKQHSNIFRCQIYEKNNSSQYVENNMSSFNNYAIYETGEGLYYKFSFETTVPLLFIEPVLELGIIMKQNSSTSRDVDIYNLSLIEVEKMDETKYIFLDPNTVDINNYKDDIFIHTVVTGDNISPYYEDVVGIHNFKVKSYIKRLNSFEFEDSKIQNLFTDLLETIAKGEIKAEVKYYIFYKKREKITWVTENLGFNKNINKIEIENDFKVNLKDNTPIELYGGSNENTYYSFFGVRDSDINVEDIYVRFPRYQGRDFNGNYVSDILEYYDDDTVPAVDIYENGGDTPLVLSSNIGLKGSFYQNGNYYAAKGATTPTAWKDNISQPVSLYGKNVSKDVFEEKNAVVYGYAGASLDQSKEGTNQCFKSVNIKSLSMGCDSYPYLKVFDKENNMIYAVYSRGRDANDIELILNQELNRWEIILKTENWYNNMYDALNFQNPIDVSQRWIWTNDFIRINIGGCWYSGEPAPCYFSIIFGNEEQTIGNSAGSYNAFMQYNFTKVSFPQTYCKLFKVTSYDYETGEFVIAGGLEREILNTDRYEVWQRTVNESMTNEYNITEVAYQYTRLYPPSENYKDVAYVGDTKILKDGIKIMNNTNSRIFIQPNVNFYSDEYNHPYLYLDNYAQRLEFPYNYMVYDDGFTIEDRTIETLDGSQWLLSYNTTSDIDITPGLTYKLYMDTCKSTPSNWFYGRNIANITMRVGEYNYIQEQLDKGYVRPVDFIDFKQTFNDITNKKIGNNCLIQCVDAYFMATYDQLSIPIKRYRYKLYDSSMNLINDSGYIYDNHISYGVRGLRNEEIYLLYFEMEDQLGYVYHYEEKIIVKYIEYNTNIIQLQLTNKDSQGCIVGDFVTLVEAKTDFVTDRDTYDEDGNIIKKGTLIKQGMVYAKLCTQDDFVNNLSCSILDDVFIYRRNKEKLLSFVCKINLSKDQIITGTDESDHRYGFIDYGVYNNEYYDYVVILKQKDLTTDSHLGNMEYTYSESRCKTSFNGWILVDIEKDDVSNSYYVSDQVWNFKYNLESQDLTQNTSVSKWDTLGKYANVYIGQKNYISSGLTCLLGDVGTYYTYNGNNFKENFGYFEQPFESVNYDDIHDIISNEVLTNNIDKYLSWKTFNNNGNPKLLKDYKGNMWIVQIMENPTVKNADNSQEQVYTISFNWVEIMDWRKYPILGKNISFDREAAANDEIMDILQPWDYSYNSEDMFYKLNKVQDDWAYNNVMSYSSPLMVSGRITLETNSMIGKLNDSYLGNSVLADDKEFLYSMSNEEVELLYNNKGAFMSPFKTKQLNDTYDYSPNLTYLYFEQSLSYENNSIDFVCCGMKLLNGININLTDAIKTARYAFAGTSISTDEQYQIIINTNNYINTYGMLDDLQGNGIVTIKWGTLAEDPDLMTYAELYERYWTNDNIILDCKLNFNINDWVSETIIDENGNIDGISYTKKIILKSYEGTLTSVYIPKFYKDGNGEIYLIELSEDFNI